MRNSDAPSYARVRRSNLYGFWLQFQGKDSKTKLVARGRQRQMTGG